MARDEKRPPEYKLTIKAKEGNQKQQVGVGWSNEYGGVNISLDPAVTLDRNLLKDFYLSMWPVSDEEYARTYERMNGVKPPKRDVAKGSGKDDDVPF
jgi:hypothetical protein